MYLKNWKYPRTYIYPKNNECIKKNEIKKRIFCFLGAFVDSYQM